MRAWADRVRGSRGGMTETTENLSQVTARIPPIPPPLPDPERPVEPDAVPPIPEPDPDRPVDPAPTPYPVPDPDRPVGPDPDRPVTPEPEPSPNLRGVAV